ncbi:MAG: hypothetical protein A2744_01545 [Candidatus Buchananbacteria bacterium RIFCSPHIGHO2_01_FULL_44_11]|uniref:GTP cyclohydrolase 1 type 2 homolog n=1 Tax=Candidatus Buchananbacteria bacterium RIFCSPHIGHO2_01_FULL_44_11 TaxID=1797535 RepID=A0A1G1XZH9_9BACT|nr:MAG: hypothetical protein A2744_01545 [Candidatus Buchananbacteria bacterium RIFCSPHIGHO2_01_FULL_44_11]
MDLDLFIRKLDLEFQIDNIPPDEPFSRILPRIYDAAGIEFRKYVNPQFLQNFHGLILRNSRIVKKIYLAVFLSGEILDKIFQQNISDALIFLHHPMDMESSGRGFLPVEEKYFLKLKRRRISIYCLHTPLDINKSVSTSRSIAKVLKLQNQREYSKCSIGYAGIYGNLEHSVEFAEFIKLLKVIFGIDEIHHLQRSPSVQKVGVIAGGGAEVEYMRETIDLGCDTYLSGDYLNKVKTENSIRRRAEFEAVKDYLNINLIECSHYATEKLVLVNEMQEYFKNLGLETEFIDCADYWK